MVKHIVFWTLKEEALGATKSENASRMKETLEGLADKIPGLLHIEVGFDFFQSKDSFDVALYCEFESREDLAAYQSHPEHLNAVEFIREVRIERKVVDYEI
jgi:hypothetical protein